MCNPPSSGHSASNTPCSAKRRATVRSAVARAAPAVRAVPTTTQSAKLPRRADQEARVEMNVAALPFRHGRPASRSARMRSIHASACTSLSATSSCSSSNARRRFDERGSMRGARKRDALSLPARRERADGRMGQVRIVIGVAPRACAGEAADS